MGWKVWCFLQVKIPIFNLIREALSDEMKVLEVGTASGLVARAVADKVQSVHAIDFSEETIKQAQALTTADNITFSVQARLTKQAERICSEVSHEVVYNRQLFLRVARGRYILHPNIKVKHQDQWHNVYNDVAY